MKILQMFNISKLVLIIFFKANIMVLLNVTKELEGFKPEICV